MTATDRQYIVARKIKELARPTEYPSAEWEAKRAALAGFALELAILVLEDETTDDGGAE